MNTSESASTAIAIRESGVVVARDLGSHITGKASVESPSSPVPPKACHAAMFRKNNVRGCSRCIVLLDFLLRLCPIGASIAATITMGTTDETLPFSDDFFQFHASFAGPPAQMFFVIGNAIAAGYLAMVVLITSAAASAASIV